MKIRAAKEGDYPALAKIFLEARRDAFIWANASAHALHDFEEQTAGEMIHLAEDEHAEILGFISVWEAENFVHHLFVSPRHQRKGVGTALLDDLSSRRGGPFTLKCVAANGAALSFYRALGWRGIGSGTSDEGHYILLEWMPLERESTTRRQGTLSDLNFLWTLHLLTMQDYAARTWGWDHVWQEKRFRDTFDPRRFEILERGGSPVGTISVVEEEDHVFLRLIELLPEYQSRGIGTSLILEVIEKAREKNQAVRLQVLKVNPARHLYERCGFMVTGETETHFLMEHAGGDPITPRLPDK